MAPSRQRHSPALVRELRHHIASEIGSFSAYQVPALCRKLGLSDGDTHESFRSKYKYAENRLIELEPIQLQEVGSLLLDETDSYQLTEAMANFREFGTQTITEITRRKIIAIMCGKQMSTEFDDVEFLGRSFPLAQMQSVLFPDSQNHSLMDDIHQKLVHFSDWGIRETLEAIGLLTCSQAQVFRFVEESVSPIAQDVHRQKKLVEAFSQILQEDGFRLARTGMLSGTPIYSVVDASLGNPAADSISGTLADFDNDTVHSRWQMALERQDSDPEGAITLARTLLEDVCKWIIIEAGESYDEKDDLPVLYRKLAKILNLAPDQHTEAIFKQILGSCQSVVESLGSLRNRISDAHSRGPKRVRPAPRHAQLAVNLSGTMAMFLVSTWNSNRGPKDS